MKKHVSLFFSLVLCSICYGQSVDIDNYRFYVEYVQLPMHKTAPENRTFTIQTSGDSYKKGSIADEISIRGWEYKSEGAKALVKLKINDFVQGKAELKKEESVEKNKAGKVIKTNRTYVVSSTNVGRAELSVFGPVNKYEEMKSEKQKKKEAEKNKKIKEEEAKLESNPFLKDVDIATDDAEQVAGELAGTANLSRSYSVSTDKYSSSTNAYKAYNGIVASTYSEQRDKYFSSLAASASSALNRIYGYTRVRDYVKFKRLDSEKHPEFAMFDNATVAMKAILEKKRFNKSHDEIEAAMGPIIEYFISVKEKYKEDKKHAKRLKAAAMYNLAQIYLYLDQPDNAIEIGKEYVRWDHDKGDGEDFIEKGEKLKHYLAFHGTKRYFSTEEDADKIESQDEEMTGGN